MRRNPGKGRIHPKVSTMPRQQSEAAAFLDIYKLVIEKRRLQQELQGMDQRRQQILDRLTVLENQVMALENTAHHLRESLPSSGVAIELPQVKPKSAPSFSDDTLETLFLEY